MAPERKVIEAILLLADEPVPAGVIGEVLERPRSEVEGLLRELAAAYARDDRGFVLREAAGGWRLYSAPECAEWLERFVMRHSQGRLTGAALETLAIVAYKGPIARAQISDIRGVDSDGVVRTLLHRSLIAENVTDSHGPVLFTVSDEFLERMGLASLAELPPLADFMPSTEVVEEMEARLSPNA